MKFNIISSVAQNVCKLIQFINILNPNTSYDYTQLHVHGNTTHVDNSSLTSVFIRKILPLL